MTDQGLVTRTFPLYDIAIRAGGDGRTVDAYAAVWDQDAEIQDFQGHYIERYAQTSFDDTLNQIRPQGTRTAWRATVLYNHAMTALGTPSDQFSIPLGTPLEIKRDGYGLLTTTRYNKNELADQVLESIRNGDLGGYSFRGRIIQSDKKVPRRGFAPDQHGNLTVVTRTQMGLVEYGPTPLPAFGGALITSVRAQMETDPQQDLDPEQSEQDSSPAIRARQELHLQYLRLQARERGAL